jgi:cell wall-associated NlpC family hydrolase
VLSLFPRAFALVPITILALSAAPAALAANGTGGSAYQPSTKSSTVRAAAVSGPVATLDSRGMAHPPASAPASVKAAIWAGNEIQRKPYKWGGGHGTWKDSGYDCSGTVSYVLHAGGLLQSPLVSGAFARWGKSGKGRWITIAANGGHAYVYLAGLRLDTSGSGGKGPRWRTEPRSNSSFRIRHPRGL